VRADPRAQSRAQAGALGVPMQLRVMLPTEILIDQAAGKIVAEAENGSFCLLPRHIDFVAALAPGILSFVTSEGREEFVAVDRGILVKCGREVSISTRHAVRGQELGELKRQIQEQFHQLDEREQTSRSVLTRLEADFVRRFVELQERGHG
jgi:F-type H+-transporting ATPase subunit epsilon